MPLQDLLLDWIQTWSWMSQAYRHGFLPAQEVVTSGRANLCKKSSSTDMLADLFTKPLEAQRVLMLLSRMGYNFMEGRRHLALDSRHLRGLSQYIVRAVLSWVYSLENCV